MEQLGLIPWGAKSWSLPMGGLHLFSGACSRYNVPILAWVPPGSYLSWWHRGIDDQGGDLTVFLQNSILRKVKQAAVFFPLKQALFPCVFDLFTVQMAGWEHRVKMGLLDQISKARQISWDKIFSTRARYQGLLLLSKLRLEPAVFIFFVCFGVFFSTSQQLYIEKACKVRNVEKV